MSKYVAMLAALFLIVWGLVLVALLLIDKAHGREIVVASIYGDARDQRRSGEHLTATGRRIDANGNYAAHRKLAFGTKLTLSKGHRQVVVTINDRGPFIRGRTLDLTPGAAKALRCSGLCRVAVDPWPPLPKPRPNNIPQPTFAWGEE